MNALLLSAYNRDSFVEGVAALLARLPDRVPPSFRYASRLHEPEVEALAAASLVRQLAASMTRGDAPVPDISAYGTAALRPRYLALLARLASLPG